MEAAHHAHRTEQIDIKHTLHSSHVRVDRRHGVRYTTGIESMSFNVPGRGRHLRAVHENIKTPACQPVHRSLQIHDGLLNRNIKREEGNSGIRRMIARLVGEYGCNGVNATTSVFCRKGFAYATAATPMLGFSR